MNWSIQDREMMARAVKLARLGLYTTRPNPSVGCVIVNKGEIVGEGYHIRAGEGHAEVHALNMAGELARGACAYVTLEPCSHYGRTPPCALGLINAGISRVVVAVKDPNPQVAGNGIRMLEDAGIRVDIGLEHVAASQLNPGFMKRMASGLPWVTIKLASSLDGKTALSNGESKWITGPDARSDVQRLRAKHEVLVTGIETVLADNPSLNVRYSELGEVVEQVQESDIHQPLRVVLDSRARLDNQYKLFDIKSPILLVTCEPYADDIKASMPSHVSHIQLNAHKGRVNLTELLEYLAKEHNSVLIEAGATLAGAFIEQNLADELVLYQAPKLLGAAGRDLVKLSNYQSMSDIPSMVLIDEIKVGQDRRFRFKLGS